MLQRIGRERERGTGEGGERVGKENDVVREEEKAREGEKHYRDGEGGKVIKRKRVANIKICQRRKEEERD